MKVKSFLPVFVILAGILFCLSLQFLIPEGVFYSGDAGLKALLAKQLVSNPFRFDLATPPDAWVQNLWNNGLYPFEQPFVYELNDKYWITFPYTFPLVTAPFYALFGYRGFYFIPLVATVAIWLSFYWACRRLNFNPWLTSLGLAILIFASPLTQYSAMYWEHTLAVALAFHGVVLLLVNQQGLSKTGAVLSGVLIGLSVWFRPEFICLVLLMGALVVAAYLFNLNQLKGLTKSLNLGKLNFLTKNGIIFIISLLATVGLFFVSNYIIYGHPLGIHAIQVVEQQTLPERLVNARKTFKELGWALFEYLPIAVFPLLYLPLVWRSRKRPNFNPKLTVIYLVCFFFIVGVALIVPVGTAGKIAGGKQWGPRFLLGIIPIIVLVAMQEFRLIWLKAKPGLKYACLGLISLLFILGLAKNTYAGTIDLTKSNQGIFPGLQFLEKDPNQVIAMSHQFVAQTFQPGVKSKKLFFLAESSKEIVKLGKSLLEQKQLNFTYICYPFRKCIPPTEKAEKFKFTQGNRGYKIELSNMQTYGKYPFYQAKIVREATPAKPPKKS
jgi:hypothetical protein